MYLYSNDILNCTINNNAFLKSFQVFKTVVCFLRTHILLGTFITNVPNTVIFIVPTTWYLMYDYLLRKQGKKNLFCKIKKRFNPRVQKQIFRIYILYLLYCSQYLVWRRIKIMMKSRY